MASGSLYEGSDGINIQDCDVCLSNGKTSEAISYCNICCEYLCQLCDMAHKGSRATRDHKLLTGSKIPSRSTRVKHKLPFLFCDTHTTTLLDIYCTTHDEVICPACRMTSHTTCDTGDVCRHSDKLDVGRELNKVANRLKDLTNIYDNHTKDRHTDKSTVMSQVQNCLSDMQQFRKDINDMLDILEKELSSEIRQIEETITKQIDGHVTLAGDILHQIGDLNKYLSDCEKTRENDVMFVGLKKASLRASEYSHIVGKIQKDIYPIDICFQPNAVLSDMIQQLQSLGTAANKRPVHFGPNQTSILNIAVKEKRTINVTSSSVCGCTFMPDGHVVLACGKDGLKLFDENFLLKTQLSFFSIDLSTTNDTDVIFTQSNLKQLQLVIIFPGMEVKKTLMTDKNCFGVDVYGDEIYVTCHDDPGNGEVQVLSMDGKIQKRFGVDNGKYIFTSPYYVKVNSDGNKVFVSDTDTNTVTCLNKQGDVIYQYSYRDMKSPSECMWMEKITC